MPERIGLVSGLVAAGFGSGAFIISPLQTKFINPHNWQPNKEKFFLIIINFKLINFFRIFTQTELLENVPKMFLMLGTIFATLQIISLFFIAQPVYF